MLTALPMSIPGSARSLYCACSTAESVWKRYGTSLFNRTYSPPYYWLSRSASELAHFAISIFSRLLSPYAIIDLILLVEPISTCSHGDFAYGICYRRAFVCLFCLFTIRLLHVYKTSQITCIFIRRSKSKSTSIRRGEHTLFENKKNHIVWTLHNSNTIFGPFIRLFSLSRISNCPETWTISDSPWEFELWRVYCNLF